MFKKHNINFDANATMPPTRHVLRLLKKIYRKGYNNPSATYLDAQKTADAVEKARLQIATALGCSADEIFFTSGASESNSWVLANYNVKIDRSSHHSLDITKSDDSSNIIAFPLIVSETGNYSAKYDIDTEKLLFIDLTQAIGKQNIDLHWWHNVIFASASGHKFGGILGCGILYIKKEFQETMKPIIFGSQERGLRGGTLNVPAIICFGEAIKEAQKNIKKHKIKINKVRDYIVDNFDGIKFHYSHNVINITFKNLLATTAVQLFDTFGFNVSAGSACNSGSEEPSLAYLESGYTREEALKTIRVSLSERNTIREAKKFVKILNKIIDNYDN